MFEFLIGFLCKFSSTIEERHFKLTLDLLSNSDFSDERKIIRLIYSIHSLYPKFFDNTKQLTYLKENLRHLSFDNFDPCFQNNTELFRFEIFMEDLHKFLSNISVYKRQQTKLREYFIFVNLFCFKRKFTIHLSSIEERLTGLLVQLMGKLLPDAKPF